MDDDEAQLEPDANEEEENEQEEEAPGIAGRVEDGEWE